MPRKTIKPEPAIIISGNYDDSKVDIIFDPQPAQEKVLLCPARIILAGGMRGGGKGLLMSESVFTPFGTKTVADVKVGDTLIAGDGSHTSVLAVYHRGLQPCYRLTFADGASVVCDEDHLWLGWRSCRQQKHTNTFPPFGEGDPIRGRIYETRKVIEFFNYCQELDKDNDTPHFQIPMCGPVKFTNANRGISKEISPYMVGLMLGDGCLLDSGVTLCINSHDTVIHEYIRNEFPNGFSESERNGAVSFRLSTAVIRKPLQDLGLLNTKANTKFVPPAYLVGSIQQRIDVLSGLLDTDGDVDDRGHIEFSSASERLAKDVQWLVRSLGGKATVNRSAAGYKDKVTGEYIQCQDRYRVYIQIDDAGRFFKSERRASRCRKEFNGGVSDRSRRLVNVEPMGMQETACFVVDNPLRTFLTNDFIVTHNSAAGRAFMIKGNQAFGFPEYDQHGEPIWVNISYIYSPLYRGLVIRKNAKDHLNWIEEAKQMYGKLEGEWNKSEMCFRFPSGAILFVGHLAEDDSWEKYQGNEYHRMNIEEVGQLPDERRFLLLASSLRSVRRELICQMFLSANPIGPLLTHLKENYVYINDDGGNRLPYGTIFYEDRLSNGRKSIVVPKQDPSTILKLSRGGHITKVFIPMRLQENKYLMQDRSYIAQLEMLPEAERKALLEGDWDAMTGGRYFEEFREKPIGNEPPEACHVTEPVPLMDWWDRWAGLDWGYAHETACYWACRNEHDKRIHVYREFVASQLEPYELGSTLAKLFEPDLLGLESQTMPLYISKDAFDQRRGSNDPTIADLIAAGIREYFGPNGCLVPHHAEEGQLETFYGQGRRLQPRIILHKVDTSPGSRIASAQYIRSLLRWWPVKNEQDRETFDEKIAMDLLKNQGLERYKAYTDRMLRDDEPELLPKLLIWRSKDKTIGCHKLIEQIQQIQRDEDNWEDYDTKKGKWDRYDAFRYCVYSHTLQAGARMPKEAWVERFMKDRLGNRPMGWQAEHWARQAAESAWKQRFAGSTRTPIPTSRRMRRRQ